MIAQRLMTALGAHASDIEEQGELKALVRVDDPVRRYRDAIKAGAIGQDSQQYELLDPSTGVRIVLCLS